MPGKQKTPLDLDVLVSEANKEPFRFTLGGKERELPHAETLTFDQGIGMDTQPFETIGDLADEDTAAAVRALPMFALERLVEDWLKHSGMQPGESLASLRS